MKYPSKFQLKTELVSLEEIIQNHFFKIPDYQRGYSWENKQLVDLRKDIENLYHKDYKHFTGTIVATEDLNDKSLFQIVDGQQRLTTMIILLNEAGKILNRDDITTTYIRRGEYGRERYILETNEETKEFFTSHVLKNQKPIPKVKSHQRIREAQEYFQSWFKEKDVDVSKIVEIVTQQFGFIFFTPQDSKEIGIMFEVINNRGKALSELEKIKNYFIYYASIHSFSRFREEINSSWSDILVNLSNAGIVSNNDENSFLRNCYIVYFDTNKSKSWKVYDQLKLRFNPEEKNPSKLEEDYDAMSDFVVFLKEASLYYAYLFNKNTFDDSYDQGFKTEISKVLKELRCQHTKASILPLYLATMSYLDDKPEKTLHVLKIIEVLNFRVYILPKVTSRADSLQGDLFHWANEFYWDREWKSEDQEEKVFTAFKEVEVNGDIFDWITQELIQFTRYNCSEVKFVQSLTIDEDESDDYFHWKGIRYFLASFEEYKQSQVKTTFDIHQILNQRADASIQNNDFLSLEHIWATENRSKYHGKNHKQKRRLGNFVLLGLSKNIQLSHSDIPDKIIELNTNDIEKGFGHMALRQVEDLKTYLAKAKKYVEENIQKKRTQNYYLNLSACINDLRETELILFALKRWKLPTESFNQFIKVDSFNKQNNNESFILKNRQ